MSARVYVACLASYNNGKLHGAWLDVDDLDSLRAGIQTMLFESPEPGAEEWAIHDSEGLGRVSESASLEELVERAEFLRENGDVGAAAYEYLGDLDQAKEAIDNYCGDFESLEDWAVEFAQDTGMLDRIPEDLRAYFDFEGWAHDQELNGAVWTIDAPSGVYVFGGLR